MTSQAAVDAHRDPFPGVAVCAAIGIRCMQGIPHQPGPVAAVRVVTRSAFTQLGREAGVLVLQRRAGVTVEAEIFRILFQQIGKVRLMRLMTGIALPLGIWRMAVLVRALQGIVTAEAGFRRPGVEQVVVVGRMRIVTPQAFSPRDRGMHEALEMLARLVFVAGIAEVPGLFLEEPLEACDMRVVARKAVAFGSGVVVHPLLKCRPVMAGEAIYRRFGRPLHRQSQEQSRTDEY